MLKTKLACLTFAAVLGAATVPATPALANGAASTRNIIIGGAAVAGTLLIINHNKKVHQKYAEYDRRQAETQAAANNAAAAYQSERQAYAHEAALVASYQHEVALQHQEVQRLRRQVAMMNGRRPGAPVTRIASSRTSYGWGAL